jgi:hypothetical protein
MNPDTKLILDELRKADDRWEQQFTDLDSKWEKRFSDLDTKWDLQFGEKCDLVEERVSALEAGMASGDSVQARVSVLEQGAVSSARVSKLEKVAASYEEWQPSVEGSLDDVKLEIRKLNKHLERIVLDKSPSSSDGIFKLPESASARPSAGVNADGTNGHRDDLFHWADGFGSVTTLLHPPVKGTLPDSTHMIAHAYSHQSRPPDKFACHDAPRSNSSKLPKLNFPVFDGESPKLQISRCEDYFDLYDVPSVDWIKVSSMHFLDPTARWLQSIGKRVRSCSWSEFCQLVLNRFGRDHHELLVQQLLTIRHSGSV